MVNLGEIPQIERNITKASTKIIKALHKLIFENDDGRNNRKNLRGFEGFHFVDANATQLQAKKNFATQNLTLGELNHICDILILENDVNDKDELVEMLCEKLNDTKLLETEKEIDDDDGDTVEDDKIENNLGRKNSDVISNASQDEEIIEDDAISVADTEKSHQKMTPKFMMTFRDVEETVNTFDGDESCSIHKWISDLEETAIIMNWNDIEKLIYGKRLLKADALLFIKSEKGITTWNILKSKLIKEFGRTTSSASIHRALATRRKKKDETVSQYLLSMRELATRGEIEDAALIEYVIEGLPDEEINKTVLYGAKTISEFKEKLKIYEKLKEKQCREKRDSREKYYPKETANRSGTNRGQYSKDNIHCYNCGGKGHESKDCRYKDKGRKCFKCHEFGHIANFCRKDLKPKVKSEETEQSKRSYMVQRCNTGDLPGHKKIKLNDQEIQAFVDTGSELNLLRASSYVKIGAPKLHETIITLKGIGNNSVKTLEVFNAQIG